MLYIFLRKVKQNNATTPSFPNRKSSFLHGVDFAIKAVFGTIFFNHKTICRCNFNVQALEGSLFEFLNYFHSTERKNCKSLRSAFLVGVVEEQSIKSY